MFEILGPHSGDYEDVFRDVTPKDIISKGPVALIFGIA
jgi:hypothetical protein